MKHFVLVLLLFTLAFSTMGQQQYICNFMDSLNITDYEKQISTMRIALSEKGLPTEIIDAYISKNFPDQNAFLQIEERTLYVYKDSTIIELNYKPNKNFQSFQLPSNKLMVKMGQLYKYSSSSDLFVKSKISDSSRIFLPSQDTKEILGYLCLAYKSLDSCYTIWVSKDLPSNINPGISAENINGAILRFEVKIGNGHTISSVNRIEKLNRLI